MSIRLLSAVIFVIAGLLPLGTALASSGAALLLAAMTFGQLLVSLGQPGQCYRG